MDPRKNSKIRKKNRVSDCISFKAYNIKLIKIDCDPYFKPTIQVCITSRMVTRDQLAKLYSTDIFGSFPSHTACGGRLNLHANTHRGQ